MTTTSDGEDGATTMKPMASSTSAAASLLPPESLIRRLAGPSINKAGLKRDAREVGQVIYEASRGSRYYENERRRDEETSRRVEVMLAKREALGGNERDERAALETADRLLQDLESSRDLGQTIVVIDADAFYASCHELDDPSLKGKAFGVGSGVLTTASYEARRYGCRSAMAGYIAKLLCPHLIFVKPDFSKYTVASKSIMEVLSRYDPNYAPASLDEAYMNITAYLQEHRLDPEEAVRLMRAEVLEQTGLTVSAGISANKMLSKIAADFNKPNGQYFVRPDRASIMEFMGPLPVRKIPGIGRVNERILDALGIKTCRDIYDQRAMIYRLQSEIGFNFLMRAYLGIGSTHVEPGRREDRKSLGCETTFADLCRVEDLYEKLREIANDLADDVQRTGFGGKTLTWKFKLSTYEVYTRAFTPTNGRTIQHAEDIFGIAKTLIDKELALRGSLRVRLMGLRLNAMVDLRASSTGGRLDQWFKKQDSSSSPMEGNPSPDLERTVLDLDCSPEQEALREAELEWTHSSESRDAEESAASTSAATSTSLAEAVLKTGAEMEPRITSGLAWVAPVNPVAEREREAEKERKREARAQEEAQRPEPVTCPVCCQTFRLDENQFNTHLDLCLNGSAVRDAVRQHAALAPVVYRGTKRISPFHPLPSKKGKGTRSGNV